MAEQKKEAVSRLSRALNLIGTIAFYIGFLLALLGGIVSPGNGSIILLLVILGIIIGLLNIAAREAVPLLVAAIALIVAGTTGFKDLDKIISGLGTILDNIVSYISNLMVPAAVINAIRVVYRTAKPGD